MRGKIIFFPLIAVILVLTVLSYFLNFKNKSMILGVSFSPEHAVYLKSDPRKVYTTILDEWNFRYIRLSAQWDSMEKVKGQLDFSQLDWYMSEAEKKNVKVILVVGQKVPRWPECHVPSWADNLPKNEYDAVYFGYLTAIVERYKNNSALEIWQVENEPFLAYGIKCPAFDKKLTKIGLEEVKRLDPHHPTMVTDSGELSTWIRTARLADIFGTTMYRVVWNKYLGYWNYDWLPVSFYRLKLLLNGREANTTFISELQAEPWIPDHDLFDSEIEEQYKSMDLNRLKKNIAFAQAFGSPRAYLWGAEWWYWLEQNGHNEIPDYIKNLNKE